MFFTLVGSDGTDARQALAEELSPELAAHEDAILLDPRLASRVAAIDEGGLTGEDAKRFIRARVGLPQGNGRPPSMREASDLIDHLMSAESSGGRHGAA